MKVIAYLRVSTDRQAEEGLGLEVQEQAIRAWARANAHRVAELGLGRHIPVTEATGEAIFAAVEALAADDSLTARLALMAKEIEQAGGAAAAADALEALLP